VLNLFQPKPGRFLARIKWRRAYWSCPGWVEGEWLSGSCRHELPLLRPRWVTNSRGWNERLLLIRVLTATV